MRGKENLASRCNVAVGACNVHAFAEYVHCLQTCGMRNGRDPLGCPAYAQPLSP